MKAWTVGVAATLLFIAKPICAQESRPVAFEVGGVMGIMGPYASVGVVVAPWTIRVSGGGQTELANCYGLQLNVGRVLRDEGNAKHTLGAMWGGFRNACWWYPTPYTATRNRQVGGQYAGLAYDFQAKGFFIEVGTAFGAKNPVLAGSGPLDHVYGQIGYVHRFGKKYEE